MVAVDAGVPLAWSGGSVAWARRAVTLPVLLAATCLFYAVGPLTLVGAIVADVVVPRRFARTRLWFVAAIYLLAEVVGVVALTAVWLGTGCGLAPDARRRATYVVQATWVSTLCRLATLIYGWTWQVEGAQVVLPGPLLVLIRHTSLVDTMIPTTIITQRLGLKLRFVLKRELLRDPCLDLAGNWLPNVFVDRAAMDSSEGRERIGRLAQRMGPQEGAIIYPEGTLFSPRKLAAAQDKLRATGSAWAEPASRLQHVLPPRPGGTLALLAGAPDADVVICAHAGLGGMGKLADLTSGALVGRTVRVRMQRFARAEIPVEREAATRWLFDRWAELDAWVGAHEAPAG
jgi:1-acyl-sn-glycerol-3-phosphate acyltransferase